MSRSSSHCVSKLLSFCLEANLTVPRNCVSKLLSLCIEACLTVSRSWSHCAAKLVPLCLKARLTVYRSWSHCVSKLVSLCLEALITVSRSSSHCVSKFVSLCFKTRFTVSRRLMTFGFARPLRSLAKRGAASASHALLGHTSYGTCHEAYLTLPKIILPRYARDSVYGRKRDGISVNLPGQVSLCLKAGLSVS